MLRKPRLHLLLLPILLALASCAPNPVKTAETAEQTGDALYGVYVIAKEQGAIVLQDATVPDAAKRPLAKAMVGTAARATAMHDAVVAYGNGGSIEQLQAAIAQAQPLINELVAALVKVKPDAAPLATQLEALK